ERLGCSSKPICGKFMLGVAEKGNVVIYVGLREPQYRGVAVVEDSPSDSQETWISKAMFDAHGRLTEGSREAVKVEGGSLIYVAGSSTATTRTARRRATAILGLLGVGGGDLSI
ncbi:hypothetical protein FOZ63_018552, partial [Perkinsus olseni]